MNDGEQIHRRFAVLTWAVGISTALTIATLGIVVSMAFQLGRLHSLLQSVQFGQ